MSEWVDVAPVGQLPPGSKRTALVDGAAVLVCNVAGQYFAVEDACSHDGDSLSAGELDGERIICPRHGARFCLRSGRALTPPAYEPIATFAVREQGGVVQVRDTRWDDAERA